MYLYIGPVKTDGFESYVIITTGREPAVLKIRYFNNVSSLEENDVYLPSFFRHDNTVPNGATVVEIESDTPIHAATYIYERKGSNINPIAILNLYEPYRVYPPTLSKE